MPKPNLSINFATSNKNKVKEFKQILEPEIKVNHIKLSYPELRSDNPEEIARNSAEMLANKLKKPVVVEDSGLFIKALNDFPGTCSAYVHKRIGLIGIIKLMQGIKDRECAYKSAVAYCKPNKKPISFLGQEKGNVAESVRGNYGFGHDPIFIPKGSDKTSTRGLWNDSDKTSTRGLWNDSDKTSTRGLWNDSEKTYGEMKNCEEVKKFRRRAVEKLREYLLK